MRYFWLCTARQTGPRPARTKTPAPHLGAPTRLANSKTNRRGFGRGGHTRLAIKAHLCHLGPGPPSTLSIPRKSRCRRSRASHTTHHASRGTEPGRSPGPASLACTSRAPPRGAGSQTTALPRRTPPCAAAQNCGAGTAPSRSGQGECTTIRASLLPSRRADCFGQQRGRTETLAWTSKEPGGPTARPAIGRKRISGLRHRRPPIPPLVKRKRKKIAIRTHPGYSSLAI